MEGKIGCQPAAEKQVKLMRAWTLLENNTPLSSEKIHFVQTCCKILKIKSDKCVVLNVAAKVDGGRPSDLQGDEEPPRGAGSQD
jgi:hypothetical protein